MTTAQQNRLASAFKFETISFRTVNHPNTEYSWMRGILDCKLRKIKIPVAEMENDTGYFTDGTKKDEMHEDIIGKIETKLSKELFVSPRIKVKDQQACDNFVQKVDLMYKVKSGALFPLEDRSSFNRAYNTYAADSRAPEEVEETEEFIIFLDISQLHLNDVQFALGGRVQGAQQVQGQGGQVQGAQQATNNVAVTAIDKTSMDVVEAFAKLSMNMLKFYELKREREYLEEEESEDEDDDYERKRKLEEENKKLNSKSNRREAISSNSISSNSIFDKRHQRLREDDTNSTTTNSNSTATNLHYIRTWAEIKAGFNGEPDEPRYKIGTTIYKVVEGIEYKGEVVEWDPSQLLYKIRYDNGYTGEMVHNEVKHYHHSTVERLPKENLGFILGSLDTLLSYDYYLLNIDRI